MKEQKIARIKDNIVIAVWKKTDTKDTTSAIKKQYNDFDEDVKVKGDVVVYRGMTQTGAKTFKDLPDPEEVKKQADREKKKKNEKELVKKLGGDSQVNALAKFVNVLAEEYAKDNPKSKTAGMLKIVNETLNKK